jgi:choline dehydrogenase-like flavoprotein
MIEAQSQPGVRFSPSETVDFVIVGSGAAGGIIAKELSTAGHSVVVLEQGPRLTEAQFDHDEFGTFMQSKHANNPATQPQTFRTTPDDKAQRALTLIYGRLVGGSNAHFTANFWRLHPSDFNEASVLGGVPGTGLVDWPITYEELEPYYTKAEWELGVSGETGPFDPPRSKPFPMPSLPIKSSGVLLEKGARALGYHPQPSPMAINSQFYNGRPACQHCGFCLFFMCEYRSKSTSMVNEYKSVQNTRMVHDFYTTDPKRGFYGGGGIDARFGKYPITFALGGLPPGSPTWGEDYARSLAEQYSRSMFFGCHGTSLPLETNSVTIDPALKDSWGLPCMRITYKDHPDDLKNAEFLTARAMDIAQAAGALKAWPEPVLPQTQSVHLLGTCRMGDDPTTSVIDRYHRTHDVRNLFICDGSSMVTSSRGQPTETISALAFRAGEHLADFARKGEI